MWERLRVKTHKRRARRLFNARPVLDTGASDLSMKELQRTRTGHKGRKGQKQGRNDFPKAPCLPKLDRIRPSFAQGAKGAKGGFFEKLFLTPKVFRLSVNMPANKSTAPLSLDVITPHIHSNKGHIAA